MEEPAGAFFPPHADFYRLELLFGCIISLMIQSAAKRLPRRIPVLTMEEANRIRTPTDVHMIVASRPKRRYVEHEASR